MLNKYFWNIITINQEENIAVCQRADTFVLQTDVSTSQILTLSQQEVGHQRPLQRRLPELKSVRNLSQQQLHHDQQLVHLRTDAGLMSVISQRKSASLLLETPRNRFNVCDRRQTAAGTGLNLTNVLSVCLSLTLDVSLSVCEQRRCTSPFMSSMCRQQETTPVKVNALECV